MAVVKVTLEQASSLTSPADVLLFCRCANRESTAAADLPHQATIDQPRRQKPIIAHVIAYMQPAFPFACCLLAVVLRLVVCGGAKIATIANQNRNIVNRSRKFLEKTEHLPRLLDWPGTGKLATRDPCRLKLLAEYLSSWTRQTVPSRGVPCSLCLCPSHPAFFRIENRAWAQFTRRVSSFYF